MKLFKHPDFRDLINATVAHFSQRPLTEEIVEKDYYITEALRIIANHSPDQVIFKGGTSLSKGWDLIQRFSEDIDLFLDKSKFKPELSKNKTNNYLKSLKTIVEDDEAFTWKRTVNSEKCKHRSDEFEYQSCIDEGLNSLSNTILLEIGTRSGNFPIEKRAICSYIVRFLQETEMTLNAEDESSFDINALHFKRTFVEKLFIVHNKITAVGDRLENLNDRDVRHFYDLYQLSKEPDVINLLKSNDYAKIREDCARISQENFAQTTAELLPNFADSPALFPTGDVAEQLKKRYQQQCNLLCYGDYPAWDAVQTQLSSLKEWL
ncbi:nucleotidyl transferase AbiEii/AbiGii toxin family protein [Spirulina subsalsa]|uniref:nucleotidyl transferase AbiEii/AbiGii toxin family protein n=1 Tax=Spirulina subsalsa TaxID=54311 RepID=UPI0002FB0E65|nr:nucleotidyl transferase AbiEii/AbiGii toxin family protein [Spirulina subsalsa]